MSNVRIDNVDIAVIAIYFVGVLGTGFASMFAAKRGTVSGFFLAGRFMTWLPVGASLFASNIGSEHFIGLAGSGAAAGFGVGAFELNATILLQLLGWVFLPVYISSGVCTLPEFMMKRFGGSRIQAYLSGLSLLLYVFTKISVNLYSGALFLAEAIEWNIWWSILLQLALTTFITVLGGLAAVLYTDTLQFFVMIIGAWCLAIMSFVRVGGFEGLLASYGSAIAPVNASTSQGSEVLSALVAAYQETNGTHLNELANHMKNVSNLHCGLPSPKAFRILREVDDPNMPWLGLLLGQTPASIWYWCADQMMVQRALSAKSLSHAQGATLMAGAFKLLPLFIMVMPGMISRVLFPDEIACLPGEDCYRVCGHRNGCADMAYPKLVFGLMPSGLRGLMLAVMLAALISDLTSIFNSASTLFTMDLYKLVRKRAKDAELVLVGRLFVICLVMVSILWIPVVQRLQGGQLYLYIQGVAACLAPPIAAVYLIALLWVRATESGAFYALMTGLLVGLTRLILTAVYDEPVCGEVDNRPTIVSHVHYMYFALLSFLLTGLIMIVVSLCTKQPDRNCLTRLTYWTAWDNPEEPDIPDSELFQVMNVFHDIPAYEKPKDEAVRTYEEFELTVTEQPQLKDNPNRGDNDKLAIRFRSMETLCSCQSPAGLCLRHLCLWLCGCEEHPCLPHHERACAKCICCGSDRIPHWFPCGHDESTRLDNVEREGAHLRNLRSLHQNPRTKTVLRVFLVLLTIIVLFLYIFFSVYFDPVDAGPLLVRLNPADVAVGTNLTISILSQLQMHGVIDLMLD